MPFMYFSKERARPAPVRASSREHTRQMRRASRTGNNAGETAFDRAFGVVVEQIRCAVCRHHSGFMGNTELLQVLDRVTHDFPVAGAPHDNADQRFGLPGFGLCVHFHSFSPRAKRIRWSTLPSRGLESLKRRPEFGDTNRGFLERLYKP